VIDPGIDSQAQEQNAEILAQLAELARLEMPILVARRARVFLSKESTLETEFATAAR